MVEFALAAPIAFVLVLGIVVVAIVASNQNRLTNTARDAARAAAVCGTGTAYAVLPNGQPCTTAAALSYTTAELQKIDGSYPWSPTLGVIDSSGAPAGSSLSDCATGRQVVVRAAYAQPLFVPMIGVLIGNPSTNTRTLQATAEATCEQ